MISSKRRLLRGVSCLAFAGIGIFPLFAIPSYAEQWQGTVSSDWYDPNNWIGGVPAGTFDVGVNQKVPNPLILDRGTVDLNGHSIAIGTTADGAMTITGGAALSSGQSTITAEPQSTGEVTVSGSGSTWNTNHLVIGYEGQAELNIENGGVVKSASTTIARNGGVGVATVDGSGSRWEIGDVDAFVGYYGDAEVAITNGGVVTNAGRVVLGNESGSSGTVTVDGADSRWEIGENLIIGYNGSGSLSVTDGGYVEAGIVTLGSNDDATGSASLILDGQGSELRADGGIQIGFTNEPVMEITGGAKLATGKADPNPFIGRSYVGYLQPRGENASVLISGAGSVWEDANYIIMGNSYSDATITVENGGALRGVSLDVGRGRGIDISNPLDPFFAESHLFASGAGTTVDFDWLAVGNAGAKATVNISDGAVVTSKATYIGGGATSTGDHLIVALSDTNLVLTGQDTKWISTQTGASSFNVNTGDSRIHVTDHALLDVTGDMNLLSAGYSYDRISTLQLTVDLAAQVKTGGNVYLGNDTNTLASATVNGAGSTWAIDGQLIIGAVGGGTLATLNGGKVSAAGIDIARDAGSHGALVIGGENAAAVAGVLETPTIIFGAGDGALIFNHTGSLPFTSAISGSGSIRNKAGTTEISGDSSDFTGTTYVEGGTLRVLHNLGGVVHVGNGSDVTEFTVVSSGNVNGTTVTVADNAFATFQNGSNAKNTAIASAGTVNIHARADLTGAQLAAAAGGEFIVAFDPFDAETHSFSSIEGAGNFRLAGIGGDDLFVTGSDNRSTTVSGIISDDFDAVGLRKVGTGTLTLAGINTYSGATAVDGGILNVAGSLQSAVNVNATGTLKGTGTIASLSVNSGGILAPGNSIGTLTVVGDASFDAGSTYEVEIAANGTADLLAVGGTATLAGKLSVFGVGYPTGFPNQQSYTILTAAGGTAGHFQQVVDNLPDVDVQTFYYPDRVVIGYERTTDTTSAKEIYPNGLQAGLGAGRLFAGTLQQRGNLHGLRKQSLGGLPVLGYGPVEGDIPSSDAQSTSYGVAAWAGVIGQSQNVDANGGVSGYDAGTYGLASGVDSTFDLNGALGRAGIAFGYTSTNVDSGNSTADIDAWHVGIYGGVENGPFAFSGALSYAWQDYDFSRLVDFIGGGGTTALGDANGGIFAASLEASYDLAQRMGIRQDIGFRLAPSVSLNHVHGSRDRFTETGAGVLNLTVDEDDISRTWLGAGLSMSARIVAENGVVFTPEFQLMYEHNVGNDRAVTMSEIIPAAASFTTAGVLEDDDFVSIGAGLGIEVSERTSLKLRYDGSFGSHTQSHRGYAGLAVRF